MTATPEAFDNHLEQWIKEQGMPCGILRYKQTQANLAKHIGSRPLHILDAGGGKTELGVPRAALAVLNVPTFTPEECPLCKTGSQAIKPGSRA